MSLDRNRLNIAHLILNHTSAICSFDHPFEGEVLTVKYAELIIIDMSY